MTRTTQFLAPAKRGRDAERSEAERGTVAAKPDLGRIA
jgi:hypothetical protein